MAAEMATGMVEQGTVTAAEVNKARTTVRIMAIRGRTMTRM